MAAPTTATGRAPRDRSRRLALFGALAILVGIGLLLLAALNLALPWLGRFARTTVPPDWRAALSGAFTWGLIGASFVWAGVGSLRCRRWARSVMLTLAWSWLLFGVLTFGLGWAIFDDMLAMGAPDGATPPLPPEVATVVRTLLLSAIAIGGVVLPALFVWAYHDRDVQRTCDARHPEPDWAAACPVPVLGLSLGLGACGILGLPLAFQAVVPFFGRIVTGWPAVLLVLGGVAVCLWLARATYRLEPGGWWGTVVLLVALGLSVGVTFARTELREFLVAYGLPPDQAAGLEGGGPAIVWGSVLLTGATVVYLLGIRHHFRGRGGRSVVSA